MQEIQSLPLLSSTHSCQQTVASGVLSRSECIERHEFRPFSQDDSARASTNTNSHARCHGTGSVGIVCVSGLRFSPASRHPAPG